MKDLLGNFNIKECKEEFLKPKLGMKIYTKVVMIKELE
jgi:hypothetical protein